MSGNASVRAFSYILKANLILLRAVVYTAIADLVHNIRAELTTEQLWRVVHVYTCIIQNPALHNNLHTMSAKMIFGLTDCILQKESNSEAAKLLGGMFETCLERLEALALIHDEVAGHLARIKEGSSEILLDAALIEKARPMGGAVYATEKPEEVIHGEALS